MINELKKKIVRMHDSVFKHYDTTKQMNVSKNEIMYLFAELLLLEPSSSDNFRDIEEMRVYLQEIAMQVNLFAHIFSNSK